MMKTTVFPMNHFRMRPAFWGVDRDLKEVIDSLESVWSGPAQIPESEYRETDQAYLMSFDLPGVNKNDLDIQVEGEFLRIVATRKKSMFQESSETEGIKISHTVVIPKQVDLDKIQAHCEDGVLYLAFPKLEKAKPRKIEINPEGKPSWKNLLNDFSFGKKEKTQLID